MRLNAFLSSPSSQWIVLGTIWAVLTAILGTNLLYMRQQVVRSEQGRLAEQARIVDVNMQRQLIAVNAGLQSVVRDLSYFETAARYRELDRRLQALSDTMVGIRTLSVLDSAGTVLSSNRANLIGGNFADREYVRSAMLEPRADKLYLSAPFKTVLDVYSMNLFRVSVNPQGQLHRIVSATLDPEFFEVLLSSVRYADDVRVAVAHEKGLLAIHVPPRPELLGYNLDKPGSFFRRHKDSAESSSFFEGRIAATGEIAWMAQRTIHVESLNMTSSMAVAVARDPAKALDSWQGMALVGFIAWLTGGFAASIVLLYNQRHQARVRQLVAEKEALRLQVEADIRQLAFYDSLTELPNRRLLMDRLRQLQAASVRHGRCSALLFLDLDGFKNVNDTYGHDTGDQLLIEVAKRLRSNSRNEDTVARLGGDEFVVVLSELGDDPVDAEQKAVAIARKFLAVLSEAYLLGTLRCHCSASIGISVFGHQQESHEDILKRADQAMYVAKQGGRNTVTSFVAAHDAHS